MAKKSKKQVEVREFHVETILWEDIQKFQKNKLKNRTKQHMDGLKAFIIEKKFSVPFFVWHDHDFVIDGDGRTLALQELQTEGYVIPHEFKCISIEADSLQEAKDVVAMINSIHGKVTQENAAEFFDYDLDDVMQEYLNIPDVDMKIEEPTEPPPDEDSPPEEYEVHVKCNSVTHQKEVYDLLKANGHECKFVTI